MNKEEIKKGVNDILVNTLGIEEGQIQPDRNIITDFGADSLDYVELVMLFENKFDILISDEELLSGPNSVIAIVTVQQVYDLIEKKVIK